VRRPGLDLDCCAAENSIDVGVQDSGCNDVDRVLLSSGTVIFVVNTLIDVRKVNEHSEFIKCGEFLHYMSDELLHEKNTGNGVSHDRHQ
jgi:hypothetical protein